MQRPRVLLVDNYDSYTGSLEQLIWEVSGARPHLVQSDRIDPSALAAYTHIVLGPGPGNPHDSADVGRAFELLERARVPVLGVCLGFQEMVVAAGGSVVRADRPAHGLVDDVAHDGSALFAGIPESFAAVRYHSLVARDSATFRVTARSADGAPMAGEWPGRGWCGVQFHPESISTEFGARMIENFLGAGPPAGEACAPPAETVSRAEAAWHLWSERLDADADTEALFVRLYGHAPTAVWLDSAHRAYGMGRYSIMGAPDGPRDDVIASPDVWNELDRRLRAHGVAPTSELPFAGGYVGYVPYDAKAIGRSADTTPQFVHLSRFIVIDHETGALTVAAVGPDEDRAESQRWIAAMRQRIRDVPRATSEPVPTAALSGRASASVTRDEYLAALAEIRSWLGAGDSYEACYTYLLRFPFGGTGLDAYRALRRANPAPYAAYVRLPGREILSCSPERFLRVSPDGSAETKPIKGTARRRADALEDAEAARALAADPKTRAENLMIVDLLRNDLGRISARGSVEVPSLMAVETYASVHQLVTRVVSELEVSGARAAEALFPPGSMTGAPKRRTVEMLDALEAAPRGVYSGALGYFSRCGSVDLSVVIRTAVIEAGEVAIGTGGAVTFDSDPISELDETIAKSSPVLAAFGVGHPWA